MATPNFKKLITGVASGEEIVPLLRSYLYQPDFPAFTIDINRWRNRPPDGYFHPSSHPMWPERMLYYYLTQPENMIHEPFDPSSTLAVTQGSFWHSFIEMCLLDIGKLKPGKDEKGKKRKDAEYYVVDEETGARGNMDGWTDNDKVFEFKTMKPEKAMKIEGSTPYERTESFRALQPSYYAQNIEYQRLSGMREGRVVILSVVHPFPFVEVAIPYDPKMALDIERKYKNVRQAVADQRLPYPCCIAKSATAKACIARGVCPVGLA